MTEVESRREDAMGAASTPAPVASAHPPLRGRLHPASWAFVLLRHLRQFIVPLLALLLFGDADRNEMWSLVAIFLLAAYSLWEYHAYRFHIGEDSLLIRSGVFERSLRQIPFARIHNVAVHRNLLHRVFGVAEVRLESAGGIKPEAEMRVLHLREAMALEALVRRVRAHGASIGATREHAPESVESETLLAMPLREVVRLGLISNRGMLLLAGVFAVLSQLSQQAVETVLRTWLRAVSGFVLGYGRGHEVLALVLLALVFVLCLQAFSVSLSLLQYAGFRLERFGRRLTVERGLLTRLRTSTPYRRIQTFTLREGPLHRLFRRRSLDVSTAVLDNGSQGQPRSLRELAPLADAATCDGLIRRLLPAEAAWPPPQWRRLHRLAWLRMWLSHLAWWTPPALAAGIWGGAQAALWLALWLPWALLLSLRRARWSGYAFDARLAAVRDGWWSRRWRLAEIDKLQGLRLTRGPLDRLFGMRSLLLDTAGGIGAGAPLILHYLPAADAEAAYARLSRELAARGSRW